MTRGHRGVGGGFVLGRALTWLRHRRRSRGIRHRWDRRPERGQMPIAASPAPWRGPARPPRQTCSPPRAEVDHYRGYRRHRLWAVGLCLAQSQPSAGWSGGSRRGIRSAWRASGGGPSGRRPGRPIRDLFAPGRSPAGAWSSAGASGTVTRRSRGLRPWSRSLKTVARRWSKGSLHCRRRKRRATAWMLALEASASWERPA